MQRYPSVISSGVILECKMKDTYSKVLKHTPRKQGDGGVEGRAAGQAGPTPGGSTEQG